MENIKTFAINTRLITLQDGRNLSYSETGDRGGKPLIFFHGLGSSSLGVHPNEKIAKKLGIRLIAIDRPGIGLSDPLPNRNLLDFADDVENFANQIKINDFSLLGWSAGGAFALACAYKMPSRVQKVALASSVIPLSDQESYLLLNRKILTFLRLISSMPWIVRYKVRNEIQAFKKNIERTFEKTLLEMPLSDQKLAVKPRIKKQGIKSVTQAYLQEGQGIIADYFILAKPWGFGLNEIKTKIILDYGEKDNVCPPSFGYYLKKKIPSASLHLFPDDAHLLFLNHWKEILEDLS